MRSTSVQIGFIVRHAASTCVSLERMSVCILPTMNDNNDWDWDWDWDWDFLAVFACGLGL
jgi:hypothetical protein